MIKTKQKSQPITKLTWLPNKTFELEFTIPWKKVKEAYNKVLKKAAQETTIKGFRKGRAPLSLVEKNINKQGIYEEVIKNFLPETYHASIKKHNLTPIVSPEIKFISVKENENWKFKAISCERPDIKLNNYQELIAAEMAKTKIWTPDKGKPNQKKDQKQSYDQKLDIVIKTLLKNVKIKIPDILSKKEVNKMLSRLLDQINTLGMTIEQYLASKGLTNEQLKQNYKKKAEETLKLEFILQEIVQNRKIKIKDEEIKKIIQATPDTKMRQKLNTPLQKAYLTSILAKRKALDYLTSL